MGKLEYIEINNKEVEIKSELTEDDSNFYTVLIGPNGSGKTKAFEKIIEKYNDEKNNQFSKIIFSSFTMFRRTIRKNAKDNIYISKFGSKTIKNEVCKMYLDLLFLNGKTNFRNLKELFTLLNLGQKITVDFSPINDIKKIETKLKSDKINNLIKKNSDKINDLISNKIIKLKKNTYLNEIVNELGLQQNKNRDFEVKKFLNIIKIVKILLMLQYKNSVNNLENKDDCYLCIDGYRRNFCIYINEKGENDNNIRCEIDEILKTAFEIMDICNINYVKDLHFIDEDKTKKLSNLSSGEFAMFTRFIEIAKNLEDNSLVLIDEPEISLNPKWIYQFIYYLKKFFKNKKSHFIIASQSPFIIGSVKKEEIIKIKDDNEYDFYVKDETFGAMFESIIKEVFEISHDDNKLVQEYTNKIRKESKKDIIKSMDMLDNLADSPTKLELSMEILNEKNIKIIEEHIESIEREYFATNENI